MVDRTHLCTKDAPPIKNAVVEATKRKQDIKYSAVAKRQTEMLPTNSTVSAINISVLVAEVLSKIRSTFKTMSYRDIINVVSISASRIFGGKIGQKVHDGIKNANNNFTNVPTQQIAIDSANMDKIKILQWNCRGLSNKILQVLVFLKEKDIDIVCLNEVKSWQKENLTDDYFVVTETRAIRHMAQSF